MEKLHRDERGVEPMAMKLLVGVILLAIGLGIGVTLYTKWGGAAGSMLNFDVTVNPNSETLGVPPAGSDNTTDATVEVQSFAGYDKTVNLSCTGEPDNVDISFSNPSDTVPFSSTMTITIGSGAPTGTYAITIKATSEDETRTATYELTIS